MADLSEQIKKSSSLTGGSKIDSLIKNLDRINKQGTEEINLNRDNELLITVTSAPTHTPKNVKEQIVFGYVTSQPVIYFYDVSNAVWRSIS